jgi:SAM-dependent methyltransferase
MDYHAVEETIKAGYREISTRYRQDDEIEVTTPNHQRLGNTLQRLCSSFAYPISVLEVGCGTGRHFHSLVNTAELMGVDISDEMLKLAENPVRQERITAQKITLRRMNVYLTSFPPTSFDLIYSLGMFGNGCPVTVELCNKFFDWLKPGGKLLFNTPDVAGLPLAYRARRNARELIYPFLPRNMQQSLDERAAKHPFFGFSKRGLEDLLHQTKFTNFEVKSHVCESPLWRGRHLECIASKSA